MKHSDIQEILDFPPPPPSLHAAVDLYFDEAFGLIFDYLPEKFQRREGKAASSHERYQRCCQQALTVDR